MARLSGAQIRQIQTALLDAYSSSEDLKQLVRLELGETLDEIAGGNNLRDLVFELVTWAERTDRINDLIQGARAQNSGNLALQQLGILIPALVGQQAVAAASVQPHRPVQLHDIPFVGPVPFSYETADLYFGRTQEIERLANRLLTRSVPLLIVNGLSGSGKTSLLRAGLMPLLAQRGVHCIYASILDSPRSDLLYAIKRMSPDDVEGGTQDCIQALNQSVQGNADGWLVLIVDQLERCFTSLRSSAEQLSFWRDIARILRGDAIHPIKLVLCVRSDWLHAFQTVSPSPVDIPVYDYLFLVQPLSVEQAREALVAPLHKFQVSVDPEVADEIISDLRTSEGFVHPPQLQVVGSTIYAHLESKQRNAENLHLARADYAALQGASSILRQHLVRILKSMGPHENVGWQILLRLVSDDDVRINCHEDELRGNFTDEVFQPVMDSLVKYALVVRDISTADSRHVYTLTHDYLISEIKAHFQFDHKLQALRTSERYLESGLADHRSAATRGEGFLPLEYERYSHIWRHREGLEWINPDATEYLALSAFWHGDGSFVSWFSKLPDARQQETAQKIRAVCWQQIARGDDRTVQAIEQAAKMGLPTNIARQLVVELLQSFAATQRAQPEAQATAAERDSAVHGKEAFAAALWALRKSLTPSEMATIAPALAQNWLRKNRTAVLSAAGSIALFAAVLAIAWFVQDRLAGSWIPVPALHVGTVRAFAVTSDSEPVYFAATSRGRIASEGSTVFQGDLSDQPWAALGSGLVNEPIQALAAATSGRDTAVYTAVRGRGMYRWQSKSGVWDLANRGLNSYDIVDIAIAPDDPNHIYLAAANYSGVFESQDGGDTWFDISGDALFGVSISSLTFSRPEPGWIVAGTSDGRIFRKPFTGTEWQPVAAFPGSGAIIALAWEPVEGLVLLAGTSTGNIYISLDGGASWVFLAQLPNTFSIVSIAVMPGEPQKVFLVAFGVGGYTIWHSVDEVYTWEPVPDTNFSREFMRLVFGSQDPSKLFAYGGSGLFVTEDEGASWRWVSSLQAPVAAIRQVVVSPVRGGPTYVLLDGSIFVTPDLLQPIWTRGVGVPALAVRDLAPDLVEPGAAYVGIYVPNRWSVYLTRDAGKTWSATPKPLEIPERLVDDATAVALGKDAGQSIIYVGTASCGVLHSVDSGQTWETFGREDCNVHDGPYAVSDIVVTPNSVDSVYVAADNAMVFHSSDRGRTWRTSRLPIAGRINQLAVDPQIADRVYAIARGDGFWRSDDGGVTWHKLSAGLEERSLVAIVVTHSGTIYVAATNGNVWVSSDGGGHWQSVRRDLTASNASSVALTAGDERLILSADSEGLFLLHQGFAPIGGGK